MPFTFLFLLGFTLPLLVRPGCVGPVAGPSPLTATIESGVVCPVDGSKVLAAVAAGCNYFFTTHESRGYTGYATLRVLRADGSCSVLLSAGPGVPHYNGVVWAALAVPPNDPRAVYIADKQYNRVLLYNDSTGS